MLVPPLSFTIPSVHDELVLNCRVYHPQCLAPTKASHTKDWQKKAAVIAHPYAPLGGSYDDPVVGLAASAILEEGFCVGTFNFRGAGSSRGRTSWQSKAEQNDYISFIAFMAYYIHQLSTPSIASSPTQQPRFHTKLHDLTPVPSQALPPPHASEFRYFSPTSSQTPSTTQQPNGNDDRPILLLGGYSYGAMVTSCLPPILSSILEPFQNPMVGSAYAEIRLRAESLATQQTELIHSTIFSILQQHRCSRSLQVNDLLSSPKSRKSSGGVRIGGEEDLRRASHDSHRSRSLFTVETQERVRRSVDRVRSFTKQSRFGLRRANSNGSWASSYQSGDPRGSDTSLDKISPSDLKEMPEEVTIKPIPGIGESFQTSYLLISPLYGLVGNLATMWSFRPSKELPEPEFKISADSTLAIFGDDDVFVGVKRLRSWADKCSKRPASRFRYREVSGAGHFWHSRAVQKTLHEEIKGFAEALSDPARYP